MSWGNTDNSTRIQDMISGVNDHRILKVNDVNENDDAKIAGEFVNSSINANARALKVDGKAHFTGVGEGSSSVTITPPSAPPQDDTSKALHIIGRTSMVGISLGNYATTGLDIENNSTHQAARALKVNGKSEFTGDINVDGDIITAPGSFFAGDIITAPGSFATLKVNDVSENNDDKIAGHFINTALNNDARALLADGTTEVIGWTLLGGQVQVGSPNDMGVLGARGTVQNPQPLTIGSADGGLTSDVRIGNPNFDVEIFSPVILGLGDEAGGIIDAAWDGETPRDLNLGTQASTADVVIGRAVQSVIIQGALIVGPPPPPAAAGQIDSGGSGALPQDLAIGGGTGTKDLTLSRLGQITETKGNLRVNKNELIMDNSSGLSSGSGFKFNPTGGGTGGPSMDVYIAGSKVGYWDSTGWH